MDVYAHMEKCVYFLESAKVCFISNGGR